MTQPGKGLRRVIAMEKTDWREEVKESAVLVQARTDRSLSGLAQKLMNFRCQEGASETP